MHKAIVNSFHMSQILAEGKVFVGDAGASILKL